jgi:protoheme IX farnesyltransferase
MFGWLYLAVAFVAGLWMLKASMRLVRERTDDAARRLFIASIIYLPIVLLAMLADSLISALT